MQHLKAVARRINGSWTQTSKVVLICVSFAIVQNTVYGLYPARFNFRIKKFQFSKPLAVYCFAVATLFGVFYVRRMWEAYNEGSIILRDPILIYSYLNACVALLNYVTQWAIMPGILRFQNSLPLFSTIDFFSISLRSVARSVLLAGIKMLGCSMLMQLTLLVYQKHKQPELSWRSNFMIMLPIYLGNQLNNCFFGGIVLGKIVLVEINKRLSDILTEVNRLQTPMEMLLQKPYYRMQRFCDLADRIDELAGKYTLATGYSMGFLVIGGFSLVISMSINLISTTLGFYTQYQSIADHTMLGKAYDVPRALAHFVFLAVPFMEIFLVARVSQQVLDEAKKTGNLLQLISLEHADVRFKQAVEALWLEANTSQYKLMPLGLLELDSSLINKMFSAVSGFLLFFIQNDLTLRLSLK